MNKEEWLKKGYVDEPVEKNLDLKAEIKKLCREKEAVILGPVSYTHLTLPTKA